LFSESVLMGFLQQRVPGPPFGYIRKLNLCHACIGHASVPRWSRRPSLWCCSSPSSSTIR